MTETEPMVPARLLGDLIEQQATTMAAVQMILDLLAGISAQIARLEKRHDA
jgi:hypothetical protein